MYGWIIIAFSAFAVVSQTTETTNVTTYYNETNSSTSEYNETTTTSRYILCYDINAYFPKLEPTKGINNTFKCRSEWGCSCMQIGNLLSYFCGAHKCPVEKEYKGCFWDDIHYICCCYTELCNWNNSDFKFTPPTTKPTTPTTVTQVQDGKGGTDDDYEDDEETSFANSTKFLSILFMLLYIRITIST